VILFVTGEYPPDLGGVGDYTARLRTGLEQGGWLTDVVTRRQVGRWDARSLLWLLRHAPRHGIVHIQYQAAAFDLLGDICLLPSLLRRLRPQLRTVTTFHDARLPYLFPRANGLRPKALQLLARTSDVVIAADSRDLRTLGGPSPRHVQIPIGSNIPCQPPAGYERAAFRRELALSQDDLTVVYFGTLNSSKGASLVLDAFAAIRRQQPRARLLLLGGEASASDPNDRRSASMLRERIDRLGTAVIRTGWLAAGQLSAYLLAGDVALLPFLDGASARRGSLLACAEHGLPIVSSEPAAAEVRAYIEAVALDPAELAGAVLGVWRQPGKLRAGSRALASEVSWPHLAAQHVDVYERLLYSRT
jgi:glycosyltransferase involved in cell wall biosynthesis